MSESIFSSKRLYQRHIPLFIASALVGLFIFNFVTGYLKPQVDYANNTGVTIAFFTQSFGILVLLLYNIGILRKEKTYSSKRFYTSAVLIGAFLLFFLWPFFVPQGTGDPLYKLVYMDLVGFIEVPAAHLGTAFGYAAACIRYLRITSFDSLFFFLCFFLFILKELTVFPAISPVFTVIGTYIENTIGTPNIRLLTFVAGISAIIIAVRTLLAREKGIIEEEVME
jgi:hypothetical protein